jgi:TPR repeat protein
MLFGFTRSENPFAAIEMYRKEGEKSNCHPTALNALGEIYEKGKFVQKDLTKAVSYYRKSA